MKAQRKAGNLSIELPLITPRPSASGKSLIVATSRGVKRTSIKIQGKPVHVVANAFIYERVKHKGRKALVKSSEGKGQATGKRQRGLSAKK
jgi:hypothetical protein